MSEDLARFYELIGQHKNAGNARREGKTYTVKNVNVNLNDLISKLREGGMAVPYKCRSCGPAITVDKNSKPEGLAFCSYCGSAVDMETLVSLLRLALG